jgi:hypothetical protein
MLRSSLEVILVTSLRLRNESQYDEVLLSLDGCCDSSVTGSNPGAGTHEFW